MWSERVYYTKENLLDFLWTILQKLLLRDCPHIISHTDHTGTQ